LLLGICAEQTKQTYAPWRKINIKEISEMKKLNAATKKDDANGDSVWCDSESITSVNGKFPNIAYVHDSDGGMKVEVDETLVVKRKFKPYNANVEVKHWRDRDDYGTDDLVYGFNLISVITFTVSIICAAILVAFIIYYNTQKKRRETGILRAIGIKGRIFLIFFIFEGVLFSLIGVATGTGLYYILEAFLRAHPIIMPFGDLYPIFEVQSYIFATLLFLGVSFIASVYYAVISSKENIIKIIRGD